MLRANCIIYFGFNLTIRRLFEAQGTKKQAAVGWGGYAYRRQGCEHIDTHDKSAIFNRVRTVPCENCVHRRGCSAISDGTMALFRIFINVRGLYSRLRENKRIYLFSIKSNGT